MPIRILMIDDHPLIAEGYRAILLQTIKEDIEISTSYSLKDAYQKIFDNNRDELFDIIFLDVSMPAFKEKNINNGIELGKLIREKLPKIKLIMLTMHSEPIVLFDIYEVVYPEGFMVKTDIDHEQFKLAFENVVGGKHYYSNTPTDAIRKVSVQNFCKDEINRQVLLLISQRFTIKEIANALKISESNVDKRKAVIKDFLNIKNGKDADIIVVSKKLGLL